MDKTNLSTAADKDPVKSRLAKLHSAADAARQAGRRDEAIKHYLSAATIAPTDPYARYWLATCYQESGNLELAQHHCSAGLALQPSQIGLLLRMGSIASLVEDHRLALDCYLKAAAFDPDIPDIDSMIADQNCILGNATDGVVYFDRALQKDPRSVRLQSNRLFVLNYTTLMGPQELFEEHRRWGELQLRHLHDQEYAHPNQRHPERKLRIGYVSGDLREHAVSFFVEPLLQHHDRNSFAITCFDASRHPDDDVTRQLKAYGHAWRKVSELNDEELARTIRADAIDILIDLSGHTRMNRLLAFARRPAPVQATWLGYLGTTGLTSIDYRITDAYLDPPGTTERYHTEKLVRLANGCCFVPPANSPAVAELPASRRGYVTFGSVNQWSKVNDGVRALWSELLKAVPEARLIIIARGAQNVAFENEVVASFANRGIEPARISVVPPTSLREFLNRLNEIDIGLDPFPYGGGTTTMHSLWMGVPVVTLAGATAFSRNSIGPLVEAGLDHLVAKTPAEYVRTAACLAGDVERLAATRRQLRQRMIDSPLVAQKQFALNIEAAYRNLWRKYCGRAR